MINITKEDFADLFAALDQLAALDDELGINIDQPRKDIYAEIGDRIFTLFDNSSVCL